MNLGDLKPYLNKQNILAHWAKFKIDWSMNHNNIRKNLLVNGSEALLALIVMVSIPCIDNHNNQTQAQARYQRKENILANYHDTPVIHAKMPKTNKKHGFVNEFAQLDEELPEQDRILPSIVIAQAGLESSWGHSQLYEEANNPFGMKGTYHGQYIPCKATEYIKGKKVYQTAYFKKYPDLEDAVKDHNKMLIDNYLEDAGDLSSYISIAKTLQNNHYATDPNYAEKLDIYIQENNLDRFD